MIIQWKIYYGDGSTFSSLQGKYKDAPSWGIQAIQQLDPDQGKTILSNFDYYWFSIEHDCWLGGDLIGLVDFLSKDGVVKIGRVLPQHIYRKIMQSATDDKDFPDSGLYTTQKGTNL